MYIKKKLYRFLILLSLVVLSFPAESKLFAIGEEMTPNNVLISMGHKGGGGHHSRHGGHRGHRSSHRGSHHAGAGHRTGTHMRGQGIYRNYQNYSPSLPEFQNEIEYPQTENEYPQYYFYEMDESNDLPPQMLFQMSQVPTDTDTDNNPTLPPDEDQPPFELSQKPPEESPPQVIQKKLSPKVDLRQLPQEIRTAVFSSCFKRYWDPNEKDPFMKNLNYNFIVACVVETMNRYLQQHPGGPPPQEQEPPETPQPQASPQPPPIASSI